VLLVGECRVLDDDLRHPMARGKPYVVRRSVDATSRAAGVAFTTTVEPGGRG
jgi:hypothetical protein